MSKKKNCHHHHHPCYHDHRGLHCRRLNPLRCHYKVCATAMACLDKTPGHADPAEKKRLREEYRPHYPSSASPTGRQMHRHRRPYVWAALGTDGCRYSLEPVLTKGTNIIILEIVRLDSTFTNGCRSRLTPIVAALVQPICWSFF